MIYFVHILFRQDMLLEDLGSTWFRNHSTLGLPEPDNHHSHFKPDYILLQIGYSACYLPYNTTTHTNEDMISKTEKTIPQFMTSLKEIMSTSLTEDGSNSTLILSLPGRSYLKDYRANTCTWRMNRILAYHAHMNGFIVIEREEIEHRLVFKSEHSNHPFLEVKIGGLDTPAPQIIATTFLSLIACLQSNISFVLV
jgi:hypothetical protein